MHVAVRNLMPWFQLVRLPNLLTVPGDPIIGALLASIGSGQPVGGLTLLFVSGAALCLYCFGLILNDLLDLATDTLERPDRPLPSGTITAHQARMAAIAMGLSGLNLALATGRSALLLAAVLAGMIFLYNAVLKRIPVVGVFAMGLCRGLSILLGAAAAQPALLTPPYAAITPVLMTACGMTVYVAAFSSVAKHEMAAQKPNGKIPWLPFLTLLAFLPALLIVMSTKHRLVGISATVYVFLMVMTLMRAWLLGGICYRLQPVPVTVGGHIRNLLLVQACCCLVTGPGGLFPALFFTCLSFVFTRFATWFYSS